MKLYTIVQYKFTRYGIEYIHTYVLSEESFILFLENSNIYPVIFNSTGEQVGKQLISNKEFYDGLYKDLTRDKNYIISCR